MANRHANDSPNGVPKPDRSIDASPGSHEPPSLAGLVPQDDPIAQKLPPSVQIFCVGGAVRDVLLEEPSQDRDFVVVGATVDQMLAAGFRPVGQDFPVFLHPKTHAEYALARTERKSGQGYKGFVFLADPSVRLEDDLSRRDLTINSIAVDRHGALIDPHQGLRDLRQRVLRHVGPAFSEDPVRLLRLARFAARWPDFSVASETLALATDIVAKGETRALVPERVWQEISKGLMEAKPSKMIRLLMDVQALASVTGCSEPPSEKMLESLDNAAREQLPLSARYALLTELLHDQSSFKAPSSCVDLARIYAAAIQELAKLRSAIELSNTSNQLSQSMSQSAQEEAIRYLTEWFSRMDLWRKPERFQELLSCLGLSQHLPPSERKHLAALGHELNTPEAQQRVSKVAQEAQSLGRPVAEAVQKARGLILAEVLNRIS